MTRLLDDEIAGEDGPDFGPSRDRSEWDQLFASLHAAEKLPSLATLPDFSRLAFEPCPRMPDFDARSFTPSRDMPAAFREAAAFNFDWGTINVGDPVVVAALAEAQKVERLHDGYGAAYRCDSCLSAGILGSVFDWAGALFVHLLTCPHFRP